MINKRFLLLMMALGSLGLSLSGQTLTSNDVFNPKGWKLPGKELFLLYKTEKVSLPGVPREIILEKLDARSESTDTSTNLPYDPCDKFEPRDVHLIDHVFALSIYKTTDGRIICYFCSRDLRSENPELGSLGCAMSNLVCDLDGDGSYESQFPVSVGEPGYTELLASIARIRLGLSEESWLVSLLLKSALKQIKSPARE